ncbi:CRISPR system precrRNA processing endoribonuclease RAMP protein Cas6 [bacterium]|nr:CRISPR system precrRNA processing endoribonuclease RAMP protein Cas6 [bacterium]
MVLYNFDVGLYRLELLAEDEIELPPYSGSTFRGGFGYAFKRIVCFDKDKVCNTCLLKERCAYSYIFETLPPKDSEYLKKLFEIPRPFILEPPLGRRYEKGEKIELGLILIGKAIDYLPYFVVSFKELGRMGLGRKKARFLLNKVKAGEGEIYSSSDEILKPGGKLNISEIINEAESRNLEKLTLNFLTPTRMKLNKEYVSVPEFPVLIRSLLSRVSSLAYFYCGEKLNIDYKQMIEDAKKVEIKERHIGWFDWERYSSRQQASMKLGGIVGKVTYTGDLNQFLPLIALGRYIHVGKGATFGLGRYEVLKD